jgi:hypothetical protein
LRPEFAAAEFFEALFGRRNRNSPFSSTGALRVRDRLDLVDTPLNRTKKSIKARQKLFRGAISPLSFHSIRNGGMTIRFKAACVPF